jgi:hypothetical protein
MKIIEGTIKNISYEAQLTKELPRYDFDSFDVNASKPSGVIYTNKTEISYSKWVSPKRTRTYPFERIYNTFNSAKKLTIIPVLKDEGKDGDLDKIQFSTFSWMSLLGIFVVLGYYDNASKNNSSAQKNREKLTNQKLNALFVKEQIKEIMRHRLEAIHWNRTVINEKLTDVLLKSIDAYRKISRKTGVEIHAYSALERFHQRVLEDIESYREISLRGSQGASNREYLTNHINEYLGDGDKVQLVLQNYLGGTYFLTADELVKERTSWVIQESKNTTAGVLPSLSDIKDGLFKLILYSNIDKLQIDKKSVKFSTRLKLTGPLLKGEIQLPARESQIQSYFDKNSRILRPTTMGTIRLLNQEVKENRNMSIVIAPNK